MLLSTILLSCHFAKKYKSEKALGKSFALLDTRSQIMFDCGSLFDIIIILVDAMGGVLVSKTVCI